MDLMDTIYEVMIEAFTNEDDLMEYAVIYGIQESPLVQRRLFQLRNPEYEDDFVREELDGILEHLRSSENEDFEMALEYVQEKQEIEDTLKTYLFDEEMNGLAEACLNDGEWSQEGRGSPQPGPSYQPDENMYTIELKRTRTFVKSAATEKVYKIKINENHNGQLLKDIRGNLHQMFDDVLDKTRGASNDLGRVVIHHESLHDAIVVPLQPWDQLDADIVMGTIEKVLNSQEDLKVHDSMEVTVGSINLPKGSGGPRRRITRLKGEKNSLHLKTSIVTIENDDQLCMARAIGVAWAKLKKCTPEEWKEIPRQKKSNLQLVLEHKKVPENYYKDLCKKNRKEQGKLAATMCQMAGVPQDRPASLQDLEAFEEVLGVRVMMVSARLGNKFITSPSTDERPCIYIYHVDDDHFHAITSITGFFSARYFCHKCLIHYDHRERHECEEKCIVCKRDHCPTKDEPIQCQDCNMTCRSQECYKEHKKRPVQKKKDAQPKLSQCQKYWKCPTCYKVVRADKRKKEEHECGEYFCNSCDKYVMDDHKCYLRATPAKEDFIPKFVYFDFECSQDETCECSEGYKSSRKLHCKRCTSQKVCNSCSKCQHCKTSWCGKATHRPNFVVAHTVCPKCIDEDLTPDSVCRGCGTRCDECDNSDLYDNEDPGPCKGKCGFREVTFEGADTADQFGKWLFSDQHAYFKAVAHNMKGYDGYFLLEYLIDNSMRPDKIIYSGSKIMYMTLELDLHIKVIDSLNFIPMKLSALPDAFGLNELKKGYFPHYFNSKDNQNYVGSYPDASFYGHDFMSEKDRKKLLVWLKERENDVFDFRKEMLEYCRSDVDILRQACLKFRELLMGATGEKIPTVNEKGKTEMKWVDAVDPFDSVTIASVCMNVFRTKFLEEEWKVQVNDEKEWIPARMCGGALHVLQKDVWVKADNVTKKEYVRTPIAKIPPGGYNDQYSKTSIQWLEWMTCQDKVHIQHALNVGEKAIPGTRYKLDGYCEETNTAYEYHGCVFHGCPVCFPDNREETCHPLTHQSLNEVYALTLKKKAHLESLGMTYVCIWDHDFQKQKKENPDLKHFIDQLDLTDRLDPRESFFGGRTNASQLYYQTKEHEEIKYVDFTSLYPWVNKYCQYPVGHPIIITKDFGDMKEYFGIAKVKILPPRGLYHPVLPYRSNCKLKFPLCRTCADSENQGPCTCSDEDRALTGTWCTPEIQTALIQGYQIQKIYEVYHWEETTQYDPNTGKGGLFAKYINTFLKFKQEASGPPTWITTEQDAEKYIQQYFEKEGVSMDPEHIKENPGLRALAKLCLNSFWGKFGQRLNMRQTEIFHEVQANQFFQAFSNPMKHAQNFHILNNDMIQLEWIYKKDCEPEDNKTNIYIATFTTCWARLKLYSVLHSLDRRVLYYDTDSVIYVSRPGEYDPPLGDYLGELTDELDQGNHIVEFVSGGPKNYAYKLMKPDKKYKKLCHCKVRGFSLNYTNSQLINFLSMKSIVTGMNETECSESKGGETECNAKKEKKKTITITNPSKICRDKRKRKLYNREEEKKYQMVYTKRRRVDNFDTVPYGY